jgi:hypothetical protein
VHPPKDDKAGKPGKPEPAPKVAEPKDEATPPPPADEPAKDDKPPKDDPKPKDG